MKNSNQYELSIASVKSIAFIASSSIVQMDPFSTSPYKNKPSDI